MEGFLQLQENKHVLLENAYSNPLWIIMKRHRLEFAKYPPFAVRAAQRRTGSNSGLTCHA